MTFGTHGSIGDGASIDLLWQLVDLDLETVLHLHEHLLIGLLGGIQVLLIELHEADSGSFGAEAPGSAYSMQVALTISWEISPYSSQVP